MAEWRPRWQRRRTRTRDDGAHVVALGLRVGYWPCLRAPFIQLDLFTRIFEVWIGYKGYRRRRVWNTDRREWVDMHG